jgi:hypothetical protein
VIPAFSHCQDCGTPPTPVRLLWSGNEDAVGWWCRICKLILLEQRG